VSRAQLVQFSQFGLANGKQLILITVDSLARPPLLSNSLGIFSPNLAKTAFKRHRPKGRKANEPQQRVVTELVGTPFH